MHLKSLEEERRAPKKTQKIIEMKAAEENRGRRNTTFEPPDLWDFQNAADIAGRFRLQVVQGRSRKELEPFLLAAVAPGSFVRTDGWTGYETLTQLGYRYDALVTQGDPAKTEAHLPMIHIVFGNLDAWLRGIHHGVSPKHLQAYLNKFVFRFNRRFWPMVAFDSVLKIAAHIEAPTYQDLYEGGHAYANEAKLDQPVPTG